MSGCCVSGSRLLAANDRATIFESGCYPPARTALTCLSREPHAASMTPRLFTLFAFACAVLGSGCALSYSRETDAGVRREDAPQEDVAITRVDASGLGFADAGQCVTTGPEVCNGVDDDCDGMSDNIAPCEGDRAIAGGFYHSCARVGGGVRCWGWNGHGQLGDGTTTDRPTAVAVADLSNVVEIAAGAAHNCARMEDRTVRCWGHNRFGELGDGTLNDRATPVAVAGLTGVVEITASDFHTCARMQDRTVRCWGSNIHGQLGVGDNVDRSAPTEVVGVRDALAISAGGTLMGNGTTCALLDGGTVQCWGFNGAGPAVVSVRPVLVSGLTDVVELSVGDLQSCAIVADRTARCWGDNRYGQLGAGHTTPSSMPLIVAGLTDVAEITSGNAHVCARGGDATVHCWGSSGNGEVGNGDRADVGSPQRVLADVAAVTAGATIHTCALLNDGTARCWGSNVYGQLGDGNTMTLSTVPVRVIGVP